METEALQAPQSGAGTGRSRAMVETLRGREAFVALRKGWDEALLGGSDPAPALEHDFLRLWLESFAASAKPVAIVARSSNRITGAAGLLIEPQTIDGVPVRLARTWTNSHSTRGGLLLGAEGVDALQPVIERAMKEPWDVLCARDVPRENGELETLIRLFQDAGCRTHMDLPMESPWVTLPASWEELEKRLDAKFRQNLRRRRRRLEEQGPVKFEVITGLDGLDAALEDAFAIEAQGWKGREQSAIRSNPETVGFYASWARQLAKSNRLRLSFLTVGERRIAFQFGHVTRGRYHLPKCGFDEGWRECSPGQLLTADVMRRCIEEQVETFEFLGHTMEWKRDWTPLVRPHATLWAFRPNLPGIAAWAVRAQVRPAAAAAVRWAKEQLARVKR